MPSKLSVTVPATFVAPSITVKVEVVTVEGFILSLNVVTMLELTATPVAPSVGLIPATIGLTVSTITLTAVDAGEVLPGASLALAVML